MPNLVKDLNDQDILAMHMVSGTGRPSFPPDVDLSSEGLG